MLYFGYSIYNLFFLALMEKIDLYKINYKLYIIIFDIIELLEYLYLRHKKF